MLGSDLPKRLVGQVLQGTYTLTRLIGAGGMGAVFEASHRRLRRRFAVKVLFPTVAAVPEAMARFRREAEITSEIGHPNIIEIIDFNQADDGTPYIVMELLDGEDLSQRLARTGQLQLAAALAVVRQIGSALTATHARGIIHRDLKPSNVFFNKQGDGQEVVKLVDFGISKVLGSQSVLTQTHATMGTPCYMAPEQAAGQAAKVDARTDIYATGTILYEMLCGTPPFLADVIPAVLYKVCHEEPVGLCQMRPDLPRAVERAVLRSLSKSPADRHPSIAELVADLDRAAGLASLPAGAQQLPPALTSTQPPLADAALPPPSRPQGDPAAETQRATSGSFGPEPVPVEQPPADRPAPPPVTEPAEASQEPPPVTEPTAASQEPADGTGDTLPPPGATTLGAAAGQVDPALTSLVTGRRKLAVGVALAACAAVALAMAVVLSRNGADRPVVAAADKLADAATLVDASRATLADAVAPAAADASSKRQARRALEARRTAPTCRLRVTARARETISCQLTVKGRQQRPSAPCQFEVARGTLAVLTVRARSFARLTHRLLLDRDRHLEVSLGRTPRRAVRLADPRERPASDRPSVAPPPDKSAKASAKPAAKPSAKPAAKPSAKPAHTKTDREPVDKPTGEKPSAAPRREKVKEDDWGFF